MGLPLPKVEILKVGHHGSRYGTSRALLDSIDAQVAVISCGHNNPFGHPHDETLSLLQRGHLRTYRTDLDGTITIQTDGTTYAIQSTGPPKDRIASSKDPLPSDLNEALIAATGNRKTSSAAFFASRRSKVFHPANCPHLKRIKSSNLIEFRSRQEAIDSGRRPGASCGGDRDIALSKGKTAPSSAEIPNSKLHAFIASKNSKVFHPRGCQHTQRISPKNRINFSSAAEAAASGRRPAKGCRMETGLQ